eukprot:TRINITY_DN184_c0_g1_i4.p2 TRINITY_DN184_c0_g1~~TRINITY_DN184_c0_g1_i4.p2  ORF type:complete len:279 (-),score=122.93 TRINITY_DN184_c0_g1_i4:156-962(-)
MGVQNMTAEEAGKMCSEDPDHATRDLFNHIASGNAATWTAYAQIMPEADALKYKWNVFDVTKIWPHADYPLIRFGKLVLNRNPSNYFAEVEQSAFSPSHLVPGIEPSMDRMLQGRLFSYPDTHRHRLGANYLQIPINCPYASPVRNGQRDGPACVNGNQGAAPNYEPNSVMGAPKTNKVYAIKKFKVEDAWIARFPQEHPNSDFEQPNALWSRVFDDTERARFVSNVVGHLKNAKKQLQERQVGIFMKVNPELGNRILDGLRRAGSAL